MALLIPFLILLGIIGIFFGGDIKDALSFRLENPVIFALKQTGWISEGDPVRTAPPSAAPRADIRSSAPSPALPEETNLAQKIRIRAFRPTDASLGRSFEIILRPESLTTPVSLTGWRLESRWAGGFTIGTGVEFFHPSFASHNRDPVMVRAGDTVVISGEAGPLGPQTNFRQNTCFGYLEPYYPNLSSLHSCSVLKPTIQEISHLDPVCQEFILQEINYNSCAEPSVSRSGLQPTCLQYIQNITSQFSYQACYQRNSQNQNFLSSTWYLYENRVFGHPLHDVITLRDQNNLIIDEFIY